MLKRLIWGGSGEGGRGRRERRRLTPRPEIEMDPPAPAGPLYAVGDIHGRADLLADLLERIARERAGRPGPVPVVFLGDYVDRGEQSREVLELLACLGPAEGIAPVFLRGNHEEMLLRFLREPEAEVRWLRVGGLQTLLSFGVGAYETTSPAELGRIRDELARALAPHLGFLEALVPWYLSGNMLFVHAAADPLLPPGRQSARALLWGHPEFERTPRTDGLWVVHGHTIVAEPRIERGRIAIDTGAYLSNCLTAVCLGEGPPRFLAGGT